MIDNNVLITQLRYSNITNTLTISLEGGIEISLPVDLIPEDTFSISFSKKENGFYVSNLFDAILPNDEKTESFNWAAVIDETGSTIAHLQAAKRELPPEFTLWHLADNEGWTVAHVAAINKKLPDNFNLWNLSNLDGRTVAHQAAKSGTLPKDFNGWDMADNEGWTVAHEAANHENLPKDFDQWDLKNIHGVTVKDIADKYR